MIQVDTSVCVCHMTKPVPRGAVRREGRLGWLKGLARGTHDFYRGEHDLLRGTQICTEGDWGTIHPTPLDSEHNFDRGVIPTPTPQKAGAWVICCPRDPETVAAPLYVLIRQYGCIAIGVPGKCYFVSQIWQTIDLQLLSCCKIWWQLRFRPCME